MASEILAIPEEHLEETIKVIRAGLKALGDEADAVVEHALNKWCNEEEEYLKELESDE